MSKIYGNWLTREMEFLKVSLSRSFMFTPSIKTSPPFTSYIFDIKFKIVDFPEPDFPTNATVVLGSILKERLSKILFSFSTLRFSFFFFFQSFGLRYFSLSICSYSIYEYSTFLNSILPLTSSKCTLPNFSQT